MYLYYGRAVILYSFFVVVQYLRLNFFSCFFASGNFSSKLLAKLSLFHDLEKLRSAPL